MTQLYKITNKINNKYYIGVHSGDIFEDRYYGSGYSLIDSVKKYGKDNFKREVIGEYESEELAYWMEACIVGEDVKNDRRSYNLMEGGYRGPRMIGEDNYMYRRTHTDEIKQRLREISIKYYSENDHSMSGKTYEEFFGEKRAKEIREKQSKNHADFSGENGVWYGVTGADHPSYGHKKTPETIEKIIKHKRKAVEHIESGRQFKSMREASEAFNTAISTISVHCNGYRKEPKWRKI